MTSPTINYSAHGPYDLPKQVHFEKGGVRHLRAVTDHKCVHCKAGIKAGETYRREVYIEDGEFMVRKMHSPAFGQCGWFKNKQPK